MIDPLLLEGQILEVERELAVRRWRYPAAVADGQMRPELADRRLRMMEEVLRTLRGLTQGELDL